LRRIQRVGADGHSRASAAALKARQNSTSDARAVKRTARRTPSTSKPRMLASHTDSAATSTVTAAASR